MRPEPAIHEGAARVTSRLATLGLQETVLRQAAAAGDRARAECTLNDPPTLAGFLAWGRTVRTLRELLLPQGWQRDDSRNYSTVVNGDRSVAIAVAAGDENTGTHDTPSTKSSKGPATQDAVTQNQLSFFDDGESYPQPREVPDVATWLLLHFVDPANSQIRLELSLPADMDESGHVSGWLDRIILSPLPLNPEDMAVPGPEPGEDIDIDIQRRAT